MQFRDQSFKNRLGQMGDIAETVFENVARHGWVRYGLNRPPIRLSDVDEFIRYTPDYLQGRQLVECQGCGQDGKIKMKVDKFGALGEWNEKHPVVLFWYDSKRKRYTYMTFEELVEYAATARRGMFPEGKEYIEIDVTEIEGWENYDGPTA